MTLENAGKTNKNEPEQLHEKPGVLGFPMEDCGGIQIHDTQKTNCRRKNTSPAVGALSGRRGEVLCGTRSNREDLLTVAEAADYVGCSVRTLWKWKADGDLAHHKRGHWVKFSISDLDAAIAESRVPARREIPRKRPMVRIDQTGRKE